MNMDKPKEYESTLRFNADTFNDIEQAPMLEWKLKEMLKAARMTVTAEDVPDDEDHCGFFTGPSDRMIPAVRITMRVYGHGRAMEPEDNDAR
jgi:hypothetical protein